MGIGFEDAAREGLRGGKKKAVQQDNFEAASKEHLEEQGRLARENQEQRVAQERAEQDRVNQEREEQLRQDQERKLQEREEQLWQEQERKAQEDKEQQEVQKIEKIVSGILKTHNRLDEGQIKNIVTDVVKNHLSDYVNLADLPSREDFTALEGKHTSLHNEYESIMPMVIDIVGQIVEKLGELSHS